MMNQPLPSILELPLPPNARVEFDKASLPFTGMSSIKKNIKGYWSKYEDSLLTDAVIKEGDVISWARVAKSVPERNARQCRERWQFRIHPDLKKSKFEDWEDELIIRERERIGNMWHVIALELPGRTSCSVKARWYTDLRYKYYDINNTGNYKENNTTKNFIIPDIILAK